METRNVAAKHLITRRVKCVAREKFTKAKDENVVERILMTRSQSVAVITKTCMINPPSIVVVVKSYNGTVIKVVAGTNLTTAKHSTAVTAEFMKKPMKRTLVVVGKVMMRIKTFVVKEISTPINCCKDQAYNTKEETCCEGSVHDCSGKCCGKASYNEDTHGCCNRVVYDSATDKCCDGKVVSADNTCQEAPVLNEQIFQENIVFSVWFGHFKCFSDFLLWVFSHLFDCIL